MKLTLLRSVFVFAITLFAWVDLAYSAVRQNTYEIDEDVDDDATEKTLPALASKSDKYFDIKLCGRVREEFFLWDKLLLFGADKDDGMRYLRNKVDLGVAVKQGVDKGRDPVAEALVKFSAYNFWLVNNAYDRQTSEATTSGSLSAGTGSARPVVTGDGHFHNDIVPKVALEEAWYQINFGNFEIVLCH